MLNHPSPVSMDLGSRKLMLEKDPSVGYSTVSHSVISSNTSSADIKRHEFNRSRINDEHSFSGNGAASCTYGGFNAYRLSQPSDYSMALTVLLLLTALFFAGFFCIYVRRISDSSSVELRRLSARARSKAKGVSPDTVDSMPVYRYDGAAKSAPAAESECPICLSDFEEGECVKVIPFCSHVFHVDCIDTWLASHVTCPLCRTAKLFPAEGGESSPTTDEVRVAIGSDANGSQPLDGLRSRVDMIDT